MLLRCSQETRKWFQLIILVAGLAGHEGSFDQSARAAGAHRFERGDQFFIACISAEILMVAKLEKVSDTA